MSIFTKITVTPFKGNSESKLLARGVVTVGGVVDVHFTMMKGPKGPFAALPSEKSNKTDEKTGKVIYYPQVKITDDEVYGEFQKLALAELKKAMGTGATPKPISKAPEIGDGMDW